VNIVTARCVECQLPAGAARRCPDCREPVHRRCQTGHACARKQGRLVRYRVGLTLENDSARGSPDSWDWPSRLGLRPPERVVADVSRLRGSDGDPDGSERATP
jgi:hypothetical protein